MIILNILMLAISLIHIFYRLKKNGYHALYNLFLPLTFFFSCYLILPGIFFNEINNTFNWRITDDSYFWSTLFVLYFFTIFQIGYWFSPDFNVKHVDFSKKLTISSLLFLKTLYWIVLVYCIVIFATQGEEIYLNTYTEQSYSGEQPLSIYKIKNIAYIFIFIVSILYSATKNVIYFILPFFLIILDLIQGTRTIAFIGFAIIYFNYVFHKKKLYVKQTVLFIALIISIGIISRYNITSTTDMSWYMNAIGEFRETYITLPYLVFNPDFVSKGDLFLFISSMIGSILQPLFFIFTEGYNLTGKSIVQIISRGYGLGANIIIDSIYFGYIYTLIAPWLIIFFIILVNKFLKRIIYSIPLIILSYVSLRLGIREGIWVNTGFAIYYTTAYWGSVWIIMKITSKMR